MRRGILAMGLVAALVGCNGGGTRDDPRLPELDALQGRTREAARQMALLFSADANEVCALLGKGEDAAPVGKRLEAEQRAFQALEEAEKTFETAQRYVLLGDNVGVDGAARLRLDGTVAAMVRETAAMVDRAGLLVGAARKADEARVERLKRAIDQDRAALNAYRYDIAITMRLGPARTAPESVSGTAR